MKNLFLIMFLFVGSFHFAQKLDHNSNRDPIRNIEKVSGLNIVSPNNFTKICLCCNGSVSGKMNALAVVNGKIISEQEFRQVDSNKIESIEVLKDEKATSLYGEAGKNGVIIIKAKKNWKKRETSDQKPKEEPVLAI